MSTTSLILQIGFALITFLIFYGIYKVARRSTNPVKKWYFWVSWVFATPLLYMLLVVLFINYSFPSRSTMKFDSVVWVQNKEARVKMVDDLINRHLLDGKTKQEVIDMLGVGEEDSPYFQNTDREMIYYLGREDGITGIDSEWLLIWFEDERVLKYQVTKD
jgi:hypothetical protein